MVNPQDYVGMIDEDCAFFVSHVLRDNGLDIQLPSKNWKRLSQEQVVEWSQSYAKQVELPQDMDGVLMRVVGSGGVSLGSHIGLYFSIKEEPYILHQWDQYGSLLTPINRLLRMNLEICGYYRWIS